MLPALSAQGSFWAEKAKSHSAADIVYIEELGAELLFSWEEVITLWGLSPRGR